MSIGESILSFLTSVGEEEDESRRKSIDMVLSRVSARTKSRQTRGVGNEEGETRKASKFSNKTVLQDTGKDNRIFSGVSSSFSVRAFTNNDDMVSRVARLGHRVLSGDLGAVGELAKETIAYDTVADFSSITSGRQAAQDSVEELAKGGLTLSRDDIAMVAEYQRKLHEVARDNVRDIEAIDGKNSDVSVVIDSIIKSEEQKISTQSKSAISSKYGSSVSVR